MPPLHETLFVIVAGGSIPSQRTPTIRAFRGNVGGPEPQGPECVSCECAGQYPDGYWELPPELRPRFYPRNAGFRVSTEVQIGTIDELVEDFRLRLTQACEAVYESDRTIMMAIDTDQQNMLREVRDNYRREFGDPQRVAIPWDHDGGCARVIEHQQQIMASGYPPAAPAEWAREMLSAEMLTDRRKPDPRFVIMELPL